MLKIAAAPTAAPEKEHIMRITKLETKLDSGLHGNYFVAGKTVPATPARLPYQIMATCRCGAAAAIEELILTQLQNGFEQGYTMEITARTHQALVDFTVSLACTTTERAALVRLVSRLGLEREIRSVRWQSVPGAGN
jgi:hypothetical protein